MTGFQHNPHYELSGCVTALFLQTKAMRIPISKFVRLAARGCVAAMSLSTASPVLSLEIRDRPRAVVELFTSQGCPPCPSADRNLSRISADVIALSYHVNYWDYTGWTDTFASTDNNELQRAYAKAAGTRRIYTPQMIINGERGIAGSDFEDILSSLEGADLELPLDIEAESADVVIVRVGARSDPGEGVIWLVTFRASAQVDIESGDNVGQRLSYSQIVTSRRPIGMWDSTGGAEIRIPVPETLGADNDGFALIVQEKDNGMPGRILGAAAITR